MNVEDAMKIESQRLRIKALLDLAENGYKKDNAGFVADRLKGPFEIVVAEVLESPSMLFFDSGQKSPVSSIFVLGRDGNVWRLDHTSGQYDGLYGLVEPRNVRPGMRLQLLVQGKEQTKVYPLTPEISREHDEMDFQPIPPAA